MARPKKQTPAAEQFDAMGLTDHADWTDAMNLAVRQKWGDLPVDLKVSELRDRVAAVVPAPVPDLAELEAKFTEFGAVDPARSAASEHARLKRNASVNAWRERGRLQAALDARDLKFRALRSKRSAA